MKRVICFCLWGSDPVYWNGALENARLAAELFPGWECRFYVAAEKTPAAGRACLEARPNTQVILREGRGDATAMLWRFECADDPDVEVFLSRDADSRLSGREKRAVEAWLASGKQYHVMRDHPYHCTAMLGGMWGCRSSGLGQIKGWLADWSAADREPRKGIDQAFLRERVWPLARKNCLLHDPCFSGRAFPDATRDADGVFFVGECFTAENRPASTADRDRLRSWEKKWQHLRWLRRLRPVTFSCD
jgi:hypothetical protein